MSELFELPLGFWLSTAALLVVTWWGWIHRDRGWGLPAIGVCLTVLAWYQGDAIYNEYSQTYAQTFRPAVLSEAWLQVTLFTVAFGVFVGFVPEMINSKLRDRSSRMMELLSGDSSLAMLQPSLIALAYSVAAVWFVIFCVAFVRTDGDFMGLVAPYLVDMAYPWSRGQVAQSWVDTFSVIFGTVNQLCGSLFGVLAAVLVRCPASRLMILLMVLSWPAFFLDRVRNVMLMVLLPGLLAFAFLRLRNRWLLQSGVLIVAFLGVNLWFKFVIANRSSFSIASSVAFSENRVEGGGEEVKHLGLNMYEELCWINQFLDEGSYVPAAGELYFANLINPIPRVLWPGKPTIGLGYAAARGQVSDGGDGVSATISSGMVGSGVTNFGPILGPVTAALIMSFWCAFLARLDLRGRDLGFLLVYVVGSVGTFNFGRDITFLAAYPALFGFGLLWAWRKYAPSISFPEEPAHDEPRARAQRTSL